MRAGNAEVVIPLDLPFGSIGDVCLEWHGQFDQVDGGGAPNNNVWALVSGDNVLGEVVLTWKVSCDLHFRWQVPSPVPLSFSVTLLSNCPHKLNNSSLLWKETDNLVLLP